MLTLIPETHFDFMGRRRWFFGLSILITLIGIVSFIMHGGFRLGIDFAGGRLIEYQFSQAVPIEQLRSAADRAGLPQAEIQPAKGRNVAIFRVTDIAMGEQRGGEMPMSQKISNALKEQNPGLGVELLREESIGAKIGQEIRSQAFWAVMLSMGLLLIYIAIRFDFRFGVGAVIATLHDVIMVLTLFSLLDREITMALIAALLTLSGYSINDTIVVYDRIREQNVRLRREPYINVLNFSMNQTLSRTMLTGLSSIVAAAALLVFGGEVIRDFALAMTIGIVVGTYSSIFIASALVLEMHNAAEAKAARTAA